MQINHNNKHLRNKPFYSRKDSHQKSKIQKLTSFFSFKHFHTNKEIRSYKDSLKNRNSSQKPKSKTSLFKILFVILIFTFGILFIYTRKKSFEKSLSVLTVLGNGDLGILVYNQNEKNVTLFVIDKNTQLNLSRNLGIIRAKGIWQLSKNEGLDETLLLETVVKNFKLPIYSWSDEHVLNLIDGNIMKAMRALLLPFDSNLTLTQKIKLFQIGLLLPASKNNTVYLKDTSYLVESTLNDGDQGYTVSEHVPNSIGILFINPEFSKKPANLMIINNSRNYGVENQLAEIFEVYGTKLVSVSRGSGGHVDDCVFYVNKRADYEPFIDVFGCTIKSNEAYNSIDLVMEIGDKFTERF